MAKFAAALVAALLLVVTLSIPLGPLPPLGGLMNPWGGLWSVADQAVYPASEELVVPGVRAPVAIVRDRLGVPHIFAANDHDLFLALGYVHARDRLWQMDIQYRAAAGRLSEVLGPSFVELDKTMRTIGLNRAGAAAAGRMDPTDIDGAALLAYAEGVNAFVRATPRGELPLEFKLLDYGPETWDVARSLTLGLLIAWGLSGDFDDVELALLEDALGTDAVDELFPVNPPYPVPIVPNRGTRGGRPPLDPVAAREVLAQARLLREWLGERPAVGSNNWVVAGSRTASGKPLLAGDPHLRFQLPAVWYEAHLVSPTYNVYGVTFPGLPPVFIGHNAFIGYSETNTGADVTDFYREQVDPQNPDRYLHQGIWRTFDVHDEPIRVRGGPDVPFQVRESVHGPLVTERGETLAMRWSGYAFGTEVKAALLLMRARNWAEFRDALRFWRNPAQNFAFASVDGTIAIRSNGAFPIRNNTLGRTPVDGSGDAEWVDWVPFDAYPEVVNPPEGWASSTNQVPGNASYPYYLGWKWDPGYRARTIRSLLETTFRATVETMRSYQLDTTDALAVSLVPVLTGIVGPGTPAETQALAALESWNFSMDADSGAAVIWWRFVNAYRDETFRDEWGQADVSDLMLPLPDVLENLTRNAPDSRWFDDVRTLGVERRDDILSRAFSQAVERLVAELGADVTAWRWGDIHTRSFPHLTELRALSRGPYASPGDSLTLNVASGDDARSGPSWRQVVDLSNLAASVGVYPGGQSGNPVSRHYADQLEAWLAGDYHVLPFPSDPEGLPTADRESVITVRGG